MLGCFTSILGQIWTNRAIGLHFFITFLTQHLTQNWTQNLTVMSHMSWEDVGKDERYQRVWIL